MRAVWKLALALCLAAVPASMAEMSQQELLNDLPSCAITCLVKSLTDSGCLPTNRTCSCTNMDFQNEMTECVTKVCTIEESLTTKNLSMTYCDAPVRDRSSSLIIVSNTIGVVGCFCIIQRLLFKFFYKIEYGLDDWFILLTGISSIASLAVNQWGLAASGLGKDVWTVPFNRLENFGKFFYILAVLYFAQLTWVKMSMLFFCLRIFPTRTPRLLLWGTVIFNTMYGIAFTILVIFQCRPISYFWTKWNGEHEGMCYSINTITWSNAAISVALDVWMLAIPLSQIGNLKLDWKKKVGVGLMFFVGTGVTIISIIRLRFLVEFGKTENQTWDFAQVTQWSIIEIAVGEICTCMPSLRSAFVQLFPKIIQTTKSTYGNFSTAKSGRSTIRSGNDNAQAPPVRNEIILSRTYAVSYEDSDETELVRIKDSDRKSERDLER